MTDDTELDAIAKKLAWHREHCSIGPSCEQCDIAHPVRISAIAAARAEAKAIHEGMRGSTDWCVYCGAPATSRDHLIPRGWSGPAARKYVPTVPACLDCNIRIGALPDLTITARSTHVALSLRKKYAKRLNAKRWDRDDIDQLGHNLRSAVSGRQAEIGEVRRRLLVLDLGGMPNALSTGLRLRDLVDA